MDFASLGNVRQKPLYHSVNTQEFLKPSPLTFLRNGPMLPLQLHIEMLQCFHIQVNPVIDQWLSIYYVTRCWRRVLIRDASILALNPYQNNIAVLASILQCFECEAEKPFVR